MGVGEGRLSFGLEEVLTADKEAEKGEKRLISKEVLKVLGFPSFSFSCLSFSQHTLIQTTTELEVWAILPRAEKTESREEDKVERRVSVASPSWKA